NLIDEKNKEVNSIDLAIKNQKSIGSQSKWCKKCSMTNIDNRK
ncbi:31957_t:CDS:1, partial [Racocetra persica]